MKILIYLTQAKINKKDVIVNEPHIEVVFRQTMIVSLSISMHIIYITQMQRERIKSTSSLKGTFDKNLPTLRSSTLVSKTIIALSKVDIDCRPLHKNRLSRTSGGLQGEPQRSQSGFNTRKNKEPTDFKFMTKTNFDGLTGSPLKSTLRQAREDDQPGLSQISIEKAKVSSKSYGPIRGYSANSHPGPILSANEDRICIITNLTKTNVKQKQVSFFGVYDGCHGVAKADYLRDNFHLCLVEDDSFPKDMEHAMRRTLKKLSHAFSDDPRYATDESLVSFAILVIYNEEVHYMQSGSCKGIFSMKLGENIMVPHKSELQLIGRESSVRKSKSVGEVARKNKGWKEGPDIQYKLFKEGDHLDFAMLGSEGLFQNIKVKELGRRCWLYLLKNKTEAIHVAVGQANNYLMTDVFSALGSKNTSLILVAFEPVSSCLQVPDPKEQLILPYLPGWNVPE